MGIEKSRPSYRMKQSILWGGGWDWEGEGAGLKWEEGEGIQDLPTTLCLYFTGTIPESRLLISRLPWHCLSWQLASLLRVPPFQEWQQWIGGLGCCQCQRLAPPYHFHASALLLPFDLFCRFHNTTKDMICWCMHTLLYTICIHMCCNIHKHV